jgi:hypothetical protein
VGYYSSGGVNTGAAVTDSPITPGPWTASTPLPGGTTALTQIKCPSAGVCLAIGSASATTPVILSGVVTTSVAWTNDTLPGAPNTPKSLSQIICPGPTTCLALGTGLSGPVILGGTLSAGTWTWVNDPLPGAVTSVTRVNCPAGGTACLVIGSAGSNAAILAGTQSGALQTWGLDNLTNAPTTLTQLTCSGTTACLAIGTTGSGPTLIAGPASPAANQAWNPDTLPSGVSSLNQITCSGNGGTTACLAIDATAAGNGIIAGPVSPSGSQQWNADTLPSGVNVVGQISCPGAASVCVATGSTGTGNSSSGVIMTGTLSTSSQTFALGTVPANVSPAYYTGLACYVASSLICEAPGASQTGSILMSDTNTVAGATTWTNSLSGTAGLFSANLPVSVSNSNTNTYFVACAAGTCPAPGGAIGPLFPFASGYSVGAGNCSQELLNAAAQATTTPGTSGAAAPTVTAPLGLLPIEVVNSSGQPISGATVSATVHDPTLPSGLACNGVSYPLPTTGPDGLSRIDVIYETYDIHVTDSNGTNLVGKIQVNASTNIWNPGASQNAVPLPGAIVVVGP